MFEIYLVVFEIKFTFLQLYYIDSSSFLIYDAGMKSKLQDRKVYTREIATAVAKRMGFRIQDVTVLYEEIIEECLRQLLLGNVVSLGKYGNIVPTRVVWSSTVDMSNMKYAGNTGEKKTYKAEYTRLTLKQTPLTKKVLGHVSGEV